LGSVPAKGVLRSKLGLRDVSINDGLHMHGIMVANRWVRIPETLDVYFEENLSDFLIGNLRHIDVELITDRPKYTAAYGMKGLKRPTFSEDDVLVLPRDVSELPDRNRGRCVQEKTGLTGRAAHKDRR
jgi:hypothetical protein